MTPIASISNSCTLRNAPPERSEWQASAPPPSSAASAAPLLCGRRPLLLRPPDGRAPPPGAAHGQRPPTPPAPACPQPPLLHPGTPQPATGPQHSLSRSRSCMPVMRSSSWPL